MYSNQPKNQAPNKKNLSKLPIYPRKMQSVWAKKRFIGWKTDNPLPDQSIRQNYNEYFRGLTKIQQDILNKFIFLGMRCKEVYISQGTVAQELGISREYVNRVIGRFEKDGLIARCYRHKETCLYKISQFFLDPWVRKDLVKYFSALVFIPLIFLFPFLEAMSPNSTYEALFAKITEVKSLYLNTRYLVKGSVLTLERRREMSDRLLLFDQLPKLPLTTHGKIMLSIYPFEVVLQGYHALLKKNRVTSPFGFMRKYCEDYCSVNAIELDLALKYQLFEQHPEAKKEPHLKPISSTPYRANYGASTPKPTTLPSTIKRETEKYTAQELVTGISSFMNPITVNNLSSFMGKESAIQMRDAFLNGWIVHETKEPNSAVDENSLAIIDGYKAKYGLTNKPPVARRPPSKFYNDARPSVDIFEKKHKNGQCNDCLTQCLWGSVRYWIREATQEERDELFSRNPWMPEALKLY
jgi:hypothetical protein